MLRNTQELRDDLLTVLRDADIGQIAQRIAKLHPDQIVLLMRALHPADSADVLEELQPAQQRDLLSRLSDENAAEVLAYVDSDERRDIASDMPPEQLSHILSEMEPDDAADVLSELTEAHAQATLAAMEREDAREVESLMAYEEESAGGLMTPNAITLRASATVEQAIELLRKLQPDENVTYYLFVVEADNRLVGNVSLRHLVTAPPQTLIAQIMERHTISIGADTDQEEAARLMSRYSLSILPIVDDQGRLVGAITADDAIDVIEEEATEDIYHLANLDSHEDFNQSVLTSSRQRITWLMVNFPTALLAAGVVSMFENTLSRVVVLASIMPIIAGMGGNAGIQTLTLIVRSIALGEVTIHDSWEALRREAIVGLLNGLWFGIVMALVGWLWKGLPILGLVAGCAMLLNMLMAALAGTVVPLMLRRFGADPALASGIIVTTFTDVTGYGSFLLLATVLIRFFPVV